VKLLLDTHILLRWLVDSPSLPRRARDLIADSDNAVFVSAVTMWEIWLKQSVGKLQVPSNLEQRLAGESFESLPLLASHTREVASLPWHHRDPFDRMLIAQARVAKLRLVTSDRVAVSYGECVLFIPPRESY
jgi:PIN domain nuclease of toxin-antitoxin system